MQPDETNDRIPGPGPDTDTADATGAAVQAVVETGPRSDDDLADGGDPPCWLDLIDDQRDHQ